MAHTVICRECKTKFDRDTHPYVCVGYQRYAHADCYLRARVENKKLPELPIIDPADTVTCIYCKKQFKKSEIEYVQISNNKYSHLKCSELEEQREKTPAEQLNEYIMKLYDQAYVPPLVQKQIKNYINEYNFSYSGILKSLIYYTEIQHKTLNLSAGIGIVPYIYKNAYEYYYSIWSANQINNTKEFEQYIPKDINITIERPKREAHRKNRFKFLDEETT